MLRYGTTCYGRIRQFYQLPVVSAIFAFTPQPQSITTLQPILIALPTEGRRLSWPVGGWLIYQGGMPAKNGLPSQY